MAEPGALLLGRVMENHRVTVLRRPLPVTRAFLDALPGGGAEAEHAFRFAGPCHQSACTRWANQACQLIEQLCDAPASAVSVSQPLSDCGIRGACRWFRQRQETACAVCPLITRQTMELSSA